MIGICQGQTGFSSPPVFVKDKRSCPQPLLPTGVVSSRSPDRTCPVRPYRERICIRGSSVYSAPSFCVSFRSTAKRDQSFICAYPALREGLHGRLSLGNPPALKQCFRVYREGTSSPHRPVFSKDRRELALAESKLQSHLMLQERRSHWRSPSVRFPHSTVGPVADRSAPSLWIARLFPATARLAGGWLVALPRLHPASG
jgi:hypothetical protein